MARRLQMTTHSRFGFSKKAQLNPALLAAVQESRQRCERCGEIERELQPNAEGGEFVEAASFPGGSVQKLDAHFKYHWKDDYELVETAASKRG